MQTTLSTDMHVVADAGEQAGDDHHLVVAVEEDRLVDQLQQVPTLCGSRSSSHLSLHQLAQPSAERDQAEQADAHDHPPDADRELGERSQREQHHDGAEQASEPRPSTRSTITDTSTCTRWPGQRFMM
jgi:hypothetical protein